MNRRRLAAFAAALTAALVPAVASAALLWTLVMTPLTATVGVSTTFSLTATNLDALTELGCLEVDLPPSFVIESLGTPQMSTGDPWVSGQSGNSVVVRSLSGGGRLELLQTVQFTIKAHATAPGIFLWPNHSHRQQDCSGTDQNGAALSVTVLPALLPTPTPTPTPSPVPTATPAPTATPSPTPTPILPLPSVSLPALPTLLPSIPQIASPTPGQPSSGSSTPEPTSAAGAPGTGNPGGAGGDGSATGQGLILARVPDSLGAETGVGLELLGLLDADYVWFVPAASVALPGLLVILWVVLQAIGALAWIPSVRRMAEEKGAKA